MRRFLKSLLIVSTFPIIVLTINYFIDFRGITRDSEFINFIVQNQEKKNNQVLYINYPEREILKRRMKSLKNKSLDTIVIGTSRSLMFGKSLNLNVLNFSVSSASLFDYIEIIKLIRYYNISVKSILLEFHGGLFHKVQNKRHKIFSGLDIFEKSNFLFDIDYLKDNLSKKSEILNTINSKNFKLFYDGSIDYGTNYYSNSLNQNIKNQNILKRKIEYQKAILDYKKMSIFDSLIKNQSHKIILFVSPEHPSIYKNNYSYVKSINSILDSTLRMNPLVSHIGSLNPHIYDLDDNDFFDAIHIKPKGLKKILIEHEWVE